MTGWVAEAGGKMIMGMGRVCVQKGRVGKMEGVGKWEGETGWKVSMGPNKLGM